MTYAYLQVDVSGIQLLLVYLGLLYSNTGVQDKPVEYILLLGGSLAVSCLMGDG